MFAKLCLPNCKTVPLISPVLPSVSSWLPSSSNRRTDPPKSGDDGVPGLVRLPVHFGFSSTTPYSFADWSVTTGTSGSLRDSVGLLSLMSTFAISGCCLISLRLDNVGWGNPKNW